MSKIKCTENEIKFKSYLGLAIAMLRDEKKLTQEELAYRMNIAAKSLSSIETGKSAPNIITLRRVAQGLEIELDELINYAYNLEVNDQK